MTEFYINYKITGIDSLNSIYSGSHWSKRSGYAGNIKYLVKNAIKKPGAKKGVYKNPVEITIKFPFDNLDIDNHSYFSKCVIDAMKGILINDDNKKYVTGFTQEFYKPEKGKENFIKVVVREVN